MEPKDEKGRNTKTIQIPSSVKHINEFSCVNGALTILNLENTRIISIGKYAFSHCTSLEDITFPSSLEKICEGAFNCCIRIKNINIPKQSKLRYISSYAFLLCSNIDKFDFPPQLEYIGEKAFFSSWKLKRINLRSTKVHHIGLDALPEKAIVLLPLTISLKSIVDCILINFTVDENHLHIKKDECGYYRANSTIYQCKEQAKHILIRRGVERISKCCFSNSKLVSLSIPSSVTEICESAFKSSRLKYIRFAKDSRLQIIRREAFAFCYFIKRFKFPKSLEILESNAFFGCKFIEQVCFPHDSILEIIEDSFRYTSIKHLVLPQSIRQINNACYEMTSLESIYIKNDIYESNIEKTAVYSKDGKELVCVINALEDFKIPKNVRVIKHKAFFGSMISGTLIIPASVEVIEDEAFILCKKLEIIEFEKGSKLKSIGNNALCKLNDLIINNNNFIKRDDGVVMSLDPPGIVFVPEKLNELDVEKNLEIIYSNAFSKSNIRCLTLPRSLKKICKGAFNISAIQSITFEEGTMLDSIDESAFNQTNIKNLKLPLVSIKLALPTLSNKTDTIEFPPNFPPCTITHQFQMKNIICPRSSLPNIALTHYSSEAKFEITNKDDSQYM